MFRVLIVLLGRDRRDFVSQEAGVVPVGGRVLDIERVFARGSERGQAFRRSGVQGFSIGVQGYGMTTLRRQDLDRGLEPDEGFYVGDQMTMVGPRNIDLNRDPAPDLARSRPFLEIG